MILIFYHQILQNHSLIYFTFKRFKINHVLKQAQILLSILGLLLGIINFTLIPEFLVVFIFLIGIGLTAFVPVAKKNKEM